MPTEPQGRRDGTGIAVGAVAPVRPSRPVRLLETVAGLLSAGLLVLGVILAALKVGIASLADGTSLHRAVGPELKRVAVTLLIGVAAELLHGHRARFAATVRPAVASVAILAVLAALWWCWWR